MKYYPVIKKKQTTDPGNNLDKSAEIGAERKPLTPKGSILYDSNYIAFLK